MLLVLSVFRYDWNCKTIVMMKMIDGNVMMMVMMMMMIMIMLIMIDDDDDR